MPLRRGVLNVVGETHSESDPRRDAERRFCLAKTGSANYWIEYEFPDLHEPVGVRAGHNQGQGQGQADGADLMELRAAHAASLLITNSENLATTAARVAGIDRVLPAQSAAEFAERINDVREFRARAAGAWTPTQSNPLNVVAQAIFDDTENACKAYLDASRTTLDEQRTAAQALSNRLTAVRALLPVLQSAVAPAASGGDAGSLARHLRTERSKFMGMAALWSRQTGVWKIGNAHVEDLTSGPVNVEQGKANYVTKDDFNQEFAAWQAQQPAQPIT